MQIARLQNATSVVAVVAQVYGVKPGDPKTAALAKVLVAANPQLAGNIAQLPAGTPVVVPAVAGTSIVASATTDPSAATWTALLATLSTSAEQAANAVLTGVATTAAKQRSAQLTQGLASLKADIARFQSIHG